MMEYTKNSCVLNFWKLEAGRRKFCDEISTSLIFDLLIILFTLYHCKLTTKTHTLSPSLEGSLQCIL
jgi:hypothetical protein